VPGLVPLLRQAIDAELTGVPLAALRAAAGGLTDRYCATDAGRRVPPLDSMSRLAYVAARMPATAAALARVLGEVAGRLPAAPINTLLDVGAGPGTSLWVAAEAFPGLDAATLVDPDPGWRGLAARLWRHHPRGAAVRLTWEERPVERLGSLPPHDLVIASYVFGELASAAEIARVADRAFDACRQALVVVEPGTPRGYQRVIAVRDRLIAAGGCLAAPCPHDEACPLSGGDWCHFSARVERSRTHRLLKRGDLSWEDEKFAYVVVARGRSAPAPARIIRHPVKGSGHVRLRLCSPQGLRDLTVTRRDGGRYRAARDAAWGDGWGPDPGAAPDVDPATSM
jgi:ribosomal protein RSM22 (predicted rRNA methylase)